MSNTATQTVDGTAESTAWELERAGRVALLRFRRPPENFIDFASVIRLAGLLEALAEEDDVTAVLLTVADGVFINHADPADLVRAGRGELTAEESGAWGRALRLLEEIPQPTIAAIDGLASGGGNELASRVCCASALSA